MKDEKFIKYNMCTGVFESVSDNRYGLGSGSKVIPGFVDVHTHGVGGFEFEDASADNVELMLKIYANLGTLYVMPTLGTVELDKIFAAFMNQALCGSLTWEEGEALFREMCENTRDYLEPHFDLEHFFQ